MKSAGVDLSTNPQKTGVATIEWTGTGGEVTSVFLGASDQDICDVVASVDKTGIDCPLGWPTAFLELVSAHHGPGYDRAADAPRPLFRACDEHVRQAVKGASPMSVAANLLGATAMRCADLQGQLRRRGIPVDRSGVTGSIVEVYPAAALRQWGLSATRYKAIVNRDARRSLVADVQRSMPWLDFGPYTHACVDSDDAFDAVLCAVIAGLHARGLCEPVPSEHLAAARAEGWIALPVADALERVGRPAL